LLSLAGRPCVHLVAMFFTVSKALALLSGRRPDRDDERGIADIRRLASLMRRSRAGRRAAIAATKPGP